MSNAFHESIVTTAKATRADRTPPAAAAARGTMHAQVPSSEPLRDALMAALKKQLKLLEEELRSALDGDAESVRSARAATRRIAVILDAMRGTGVSERTARPRRRLADIRRALDRAGRSDVLVEAGLDQGAEDPHERDGLRARAYAKLRKRLDTKQTRKTLAALGRLAVARPEGGERLDVREGAGKLLRHRCEKIRAYGDVESIKGRELRRLERDAGRLLYTLEVFAELLAGAGSRLRSQVAEAQGYLVALKDADLAFDRQPSMGRRRRRDSLRAGIASKVSFLTGAHLRDELEAALA
jgi:CHAD domain-containing protein